MDHLLEQRHQQSPHRHRESICAPACGTAGFLVAAAEHVRDVMLGDVTLREHFNKSMFHGFESDSPMPRISIRNMMFYGVEDPDIDARDSLKMCD